MSCQADVLAFLERPESYPAEHGEGAGTVERIDTHAAIVFLAGSYAYKVKRAVRLPYLDFSSLEARRRVCERELELNRRTAPQLYLGIGSVTQAPGGEFRIDGPGEPVEWFVKMQRFDNALLFDRLAAKGQLRLDQVAEIARAVASFHRAATAVPTVDPVGSIRRVVSATFGALERAGDPLGKDETRATRRLASDQLERISKLLVTRSEAGFVKHCHGDLHLRNIVAFNGVATLFDALEFDDELATIDVLYDLAFLLMDLWHRGLTAHANFALNSYLETEPDDRNLKGLATLPLFLALRAAVRSMVAVDLLHSDPEHAEAKTTEAAKSYLAAAENFLRPPPARLIAVGGRSGTGKTTIAAGLAPTVLPAPGAVHLRSDVVRKQLAGVDLLTRLPPEAYGPEASVAVYGRLFELAAKCLSAGHSVVLDAAFLKADERGSAEVVARAAGVAFSGLWLEADEATRVARVSGRKNDASDADDAVARFQSELNVGEIQWTIVDASGPCESVLDAARTAPGVGSADVIKAVE